MEPTMTAHPLTPGEVDDARVKAIPSEVLEVFNRLIAANWNGVSSFRIKDKD
jgi:hypothetical protein